MATRKRIYSENKTHFVTFSVYKHINVFRNGLVAEEFIENLNFYIRKHKCKMYAYVIMPNHVHLLVKLNDNENISDLIRDIKKYFSFKAKNLMSVITEFELKKFYNNGKYQFWERGFDELTIRSERVFNIKFQYIINNPVKAGLVNNAGDYPFLNIGEFDEMGI